VKRLICVAVVLLAGCSFTPRDVGYDNVFTLKSLGDVAHRTNDLGVLMVNYPTAPVELQTYRVAIVQGGKLDYIAGARWNDFLPEIMRPALEETLKASGAFSYVEPDDGTVRNAYALNTQINKFTVVYPAAAKLPVADVSVTFSLQRANGEAAARFTSVRRIEARANSKAALADAFQQAFLGVEHDLAAKIAGIGS
jgi:ABC-type uncharacterized transport system auxiliary subunit